MISIICSRAIWLVLHEISCNESLGYCRYKNLTLCYWRYKTPIVTCVTQGVSTIPLLFWHKVYYEGDTNEKTNGSEDSTSETDGCVRNMYKEHRNEEDE